VSRISRFFNKKLWNGVIVLTVTLLIDRGILKPSFDEIRNSDFIIIAPDIDLGLKDSEFVPFFGIQTNTITAISRLAKITGADVCLMTTTLKTDESEYLCEIGKPLENFPEENPKSDTARLNQYFEDEVRMRPAEYYWVHKRLTEALFVLSSRDDTERIGLFADLHSNLEAFDACGMARAEDWGFSWVT
jgi:KDO2-lipid IV(A) lauroyltransferase